MKLTLLAASLAIAALLPLGMTSCTNPEQKDSLSRLGNLAITAAEIGGVINTKQAGLARSAGKLVLSLDAESTSTDAQLLLISQAVLDYAESSGKLTPEQVEALRKAGEVPLDETPEPGAPAVGLSPPVPSK